MTTGGFFGTGGKSFSWGKLHDQTLLNRWVGGVLVDVGQPKQQTHYTEKTPLFNKDGSPKMELPITLVCDGSGPNVPNIPAPDGVTADMKRHALNQRNMNDPTDNGRRTFWIKGSIKKALGDKLREAGVNEPPMGCEVYMRFTGITSYDNGDGRTWEILYFPPAPGAAQTGGFFADDSGQQSQASAPPADPWGQQAPPAQQQGVPQSLPGQQQPPAPAWGAPTSAPQQPAPAAPPADPWGGAPTQQGSAQGAFGTAGPGAPASNPWG